MTRLNKEIRSGIIDNALKASGVVAREEKLIIRRAKLADDVRLFSIGGAKAEQKIIADFEALKAQLGKFDPKYFQYLEHVVPRRDSDIDVNFAGRQIRLFFNGEAEYKRPLVYKDYVVSRRVDITADNPLVAEFDAIELEHRTLNDLRAQVKGEVSAIVNSVTTVKKLSEVWAEAKDLLPATEKVQSTSLVPNVNKLNIMLGLPKDEKPS